MLQCCLALLGRKAAKEISRLIRKISKITARNLMPQKFPIFTTSVGTLKQRLHNKCASVKRVQ
jgi:hypothetical protein